MCAKKKNNTETHTHTSILHSLEIEKEKKNEPREPPSRRQHRWAIVKSVVKTEGNTNTARKTRAKLLYALVAGDGGSKKGQ